MVGPGHSPDASGNEPSEGKRALERIEFIILFAWKEPTPSDALGPQEETPAEGEDANSTSASGAVSGPVIPEAPKNIRGSAAGASPAGKSK
jgi:hypothetical protein